MDDGSRPEPIEIELTPADQAPELPALRAARTGDEPSVSRDLANRRLVIVALATGLLALALGWMLGRSSSDSAAPDERVSSTSAPSPDTTVEEVEGDPIPAVEDAVPTTDADRGATPTTTEPGVSVDLVDVHPALAGRPIELVGTSAGRLVMLDLATGELRTEARRRAGFDGFGPLAAGPGWIALPSFDGPELMVLRDGEEPETVDVGDVWALARVPRTDRFWRAADTDGGPPFGSQVYEEISLAGGPTGRLVGVAGAFPILADPAGALVGSNAGKVYTIDADGSTLLGEGELLAVGSGVAVFRDCDEAMRCHLAVLDRSTGALTELPTDQQIVDGIAPSYWGFPAFMTSAVSPTDDFSIIRPFLGRESVTAVLDLRSGAVTTLNRDDFTGVEWSDDGRFAFYTEGLVPMAWDGETGATFRIAEDVFGWNMVTVRTGERPPPDA